MAHDDMKLRQERTVLKLDEYFSSESAGKYETELTEIMVPLSDCVKKGLQSSNTVEDEIVEAVEYVGPFSCDLTAYQQE
jgi:hypothetical protein